MGVTEPFLMRKAHGAPLFTSNKSRESMKLLRNQQGNQVGLSNGTMNSEDQTLRVCKRFYVALILSRLVQVHFSPINSNFRLISVSYFSLF